MALTTQRRAQQVIDHAIEVLERDGWCRHYLQDSEGRRCMAGALYERPIPPGIAAAIDRAWAQLYAQQPVGPRRMTTWRMTTWNDWVAKNEDEVIAKLKELRALV